ncbi:sulfurtransferase [Virgibacillus phasianinus]|uniref:Sulfurtransferase n=1 Tax=Virgibacillus phasianinus TaxID=2017483 RepID=A0A220U0Q5_9BACI|nr:sulfurtransferase [Virgibacillus phasianinus]ASK61441.1 sulfurtransferase [Virgibacillus phasianinus]
MSYLVSIDWLKEQLEKQRDDLAVVDVRFSLADPDKGRRAYEQGHIPGAMYLDLNRDLSGQVAEHGGNHPLPDIDVFAEKLGEIGIDQQTTVVIYDEKNDMFAARLWWLLDYLGHKQTYLLDGGFSRWVERGNVSTTAISIPTLKVFNPAVEKEKMVDINQVKERIKDRSAVLVDSRSKDRYLGKTEPMYAKAGHIPSAKNFFWKDVLEENGQWKNEAALQTNFKNLSKDDEIIVSCGSGVSACPNIIGLKMAGYKNVKLYPGSYSDWISYGENQVETKDE